ncbi:MAG: c-type cytochrome, partial [Lutimonas sp.]
MSYRASYSFLKATLSCTFLIFLLLGCEEQKTEKQDYTSWTTYAGTKDAMRYSANDQITKQNVNQLKVAWSYGSGDKDSLNRSQNQCNPIVIDGILYGTSPRMKLLALDAGTGQEKWVFDPASEDLELKNEPLRFYKVNRGVAYWASPDRTDNRIFYNVGHKIYAIDASNGKPVRSFGENGFIDLTQGLDRNFGDSQPFIVSTSPPIIYEDLLITGSRVAETADAAPGHIRAYNVHTGAKEWIFHTIPHPGEKGYETWQDPEAYKKLGGANNWAGMSLDLKKGIVYIPTGSASGDFYGGYREGSNLFANSLVALDAKTGEYIWHFQTVHHDLWDRDLPANPNLVDLNQDGKKIEAIAQITKQGFIFMFDRNTGEPVFEIKETKVSQEALPGEKPWPTQPIPVLPEPFARQKFEEQDVTRISDSTHQIMLERYRQIKHKDMYAPPSKAGSWIFPGFDGGGEWGGASVDPETQVLYVNSSEIPWSMVMVDAPGQTDDDGSIKSPGRSIYDTHCFACHGVDLKGNSAAFPSLVDIGDKYKPEEILQILNSGINMMPSFAHLKEQNKSDVIRFLTGQEVESSEEVATTIGNQKGLQKEPASEQSDEGILAQVKYQMTGYNRFLDDQGYPGITPPWGTLNAVNLNTGKLL